MGYSHCPGECLKVTGHNKMLNVTPQPADKLLELLTSIVKNVGSILSQGTELLLILYHSHGALYQIIELSLLLILNVLNKILISKYI